MSGHDHDRVGTPSRSLFYTLVLAGGYMVAEAVGGWLTNSLALLADAGHMLSDVAALAISLAAVQAARRPPTPRRTYGYHRAEVLGALVNAVALVVVAVWILVEAWHRMSAPPDVEAPLALVIATGGLLVNLSALWMLGEAQGESIGVRGAWLHVIGDALGSVGAMASAALIWLYGWRWADPVASALIAVLVVYSALRLLDEVLGVLMEGTPPHIDVEEVRRSMVAVPDVDDVHDLHVWTITSGMESLSGHVVVAGDAAHREVLNGLRCMLHDKFGIEHVTLQIEEADFDEHSICH